MNERIKELAEQVGITENNLSDGDMSHDDLKKFAELIIQECIKEAGKDENGPAYEAVARIARHFGVK